ncbi:MAG: cytochrome c1 [Proteobacteria bacterium]|nr:cytochrome c1 [Pseudomonadota bacterium]
MKMMKLIAVAAIATGIAASSGAALAAGDTPTPPSRQWSFTGLFGTFDRAAAQRGFQVYKNVCSACHSLNLISIRNLHGLGYNDDEIKAVAAGYQVKDGPNDDGEMFERPGRPADRFPSPFPNAKAAAAANGGAAPPDLSLITKARAGGGDSAIRVSLKHPGGYPLGVDYIYALLTGYSEKVPADFQKNWAAHHDGKPFELPDGKHFNMYFPGHAISMAPPLAEGGVEYGDGTKATVAQMASDISMFLAWTAEPELEARKNLGIKVLLFLLLLTAMLYALKRKIWSDVH